MAIELYDASIPLLQRMLGNLQWILSKSKIHADEREIPFKVFLDARLAPDMHPLTRHIQLVSDISKGCAARLSGRDVPSWPDTETTYEELIERINRTLDFIGSIPSSEINGQETRQIHIKTPIKDLNFNAVQYVYSFVIPNFLFHMTTAYGILRHNGVPLGKLDYMAGEAGA